MEMPDVRYLFLHQANYRICDGIARRLKISMEQIPVNIASYGNTSAASVPILLDEWNRQGKLEAGGQHHIGWLWSRSDMGSHSFGVVIKSTNTLESQSNIHYFR